MTTPGFAAAKVNLFLHVGAPTPDGFHPLSSLMVFADVGDQLLLEPAPAFELVIDGPFSAGLEASDDNLVVRAVKALWSAIDAPPPAFRLRLHKLLPIAAGLGGGSSDAGAALRLVRDQLALAVDDRALEAIAAALGSDGAACFHMRPVIAQGRGEQLSPAPELPSLPAVLVNPRVPSPTGAVYRAYDAAGAPGSAELPILPARFADAREAAGFFARCRNDLEAPAVAMAPAVGAVLEHLRAQSETLLARVSGSGASCFALCASPGEAETLARRLAEARPDWWIRACSLGAA